MDSSERPIVDGCFPAGNIVVDGIEGDTIYLHQDLRDTGIWWFYWSFRLRGGAGRTWKVRFTQGDVIGTRGPAVSWDEGSTWSWLGPSSLGNAAFDVAVAEDVEEARFSFAIPYTEADWLRFLSRYPDCPALRPAALCRTPLGRQVESLYLGCLHREPEFRILLASRHHACESMATYSLQGMVEAVLADDEVGRWLAQHVEFLVVPFVDKDGVEDGDQGKERRPRDHNRDYEGESLYASTGALRMLIPTWSRGKLAIALDMHCPYIRGEYNEFIYFVGGPQPENWARVQQLSEILETVQAGPLKYAAADNLPFGRSWNTVDNERSGKSFGNWAAELPGIGIGTSIEIPYANVREQTVTTEAARAFGRDLAAAMKVYLSGEAP